MYDVFDDSGNYYLTMESIVDDQNIYKAISVPDQKVMHRVWKFIWRSTVGWQLCV